MEKIIAITSKDMSDKYIIGYMMYSLKNNNLDLTKENLIDILYNIESAKNRHQLFLSECSTEITLLFGNLSNELFILVFENDIWKEYLVYSHNYDSLNLFGNFKNPYISFVAKLSNKSILNNIGSFYKHKNLHLKILDILKEDKLINLMHNQYTNLSKANLILDYLKDKL